MYVQLISLCPLSWDLFKRWFLLLVSGAEFELIYHPANQWQSYSRINWQSNEYANRCPVLSTYPEFSYLLSVHSGLYALSISILSIRSSKLPDIQWTFSMKLTSALIRWQPPAISIGHSKYFLRYIAQDMCWCHLHAPWSPRLKAKHLADLGDCLPSSDRATIRVDHQAVQRSPILSLVLANFSPHSGCLGGQRIGFD